MHSFVRGIDQDIDAITAAITLKHHNGRTEGLNTKQSCSNARCTEEPVSLSCATASSWDNTTTESAPEPNVLQSLSTTRSGILDTVSRLVAAVATHGKSHLPAVPLSSQLR